MESISHDFLKAFISNFISNMDKENELLLELLTLRYWSIQMPEQIN